MTIYAIYCPKEDTVEREIIMQDNWYKLAMSLGKSAQKITLGVTHPTHFKLLKYNLNISRILVLASARKAITRLSMDP